MLRNSSRLATGLVAACIVSAVVACGDTEDSGASSSESTQIDVGSQTEQNPHRKHDQELSIDKSSDVYGRSASMQAYYLDANLDAYKSKHLDETGGPLRELPAPDGYTYVVIQELYTPGYDSFLIYDHGGTKSCLPDKSNCLPDERTTTDFQLKGAELYRPYPTTEPAAAPGRFNRLVFLVPDVIDYDLQIQLLRKKEVLGRWRLHIENLF
ncbi:hypothetical protein [Rhodococcus qingshengii]|uniref:hypothetical protein n=1 Tax=Rhodococcus qingshengii TaxID=334542 RepID=UPI0036D807BF